MEPFLQILEKHRQTCQREGRFDEAELARKKLIAYREQEQGRKKEQFQQRQMQEKIALAEAYKSELDKFEQEWDGNFIPSFESDAERQIFQLQQKHTAEQENFRKVQVEEAQRARSRTTKAVADL